MLDASFDAQDQRISEIEALVSDLRRDDGALQNGVVGADQLSPDLKALLRIPTAKSDNGDQLGWKTAEATAEVWSKASMDWAEHMPDTIPDGSVAVMDITGDHWSSRWWAHQAALSVGSNFGGIIISDTAPPDPHEGLCWWSSVTGNLMIWYIDQDSAQWVQINTASPSGDETLFGTKTLAAAASPVTSRIRIFGIDAIGDYGGIDALYQFTPTTPPHGHYITCANGRKYVRVPPPAGVPCNVAEIGLLPGKGASFDCTPAFNQLLVAAANSDCKFWFFPRSTYYFNSRPNDIAVPGIHFKGGSSDNTMALYKNFPSNDVADAVFNFRRNGFCLEDIAFVGLVGSQHPTTHLGTGSFISIVSDASNAVGYGVLDNIDCTSDAALPNGHACVDVNIYADGSLGPGTLAGFAVRGVRMTRLKLFGTERYSLWLRCCVSTYVDGPGTFAAGGLNTSGTVVVTGLDAAHRATGNVIRFAHIANGMITTLVDGLLVDTGIWDSGTINISVDTTGIFSGYLSGGATVVNLSNFVTFIDPAVPNVIASGSAASGKWRKWRDGRIEQWGSGITPVGGIVAITFPTPFLTTMDSLQVTPVTAPAAGSIILAQPYTVTLSGAQVVTRSLSAVPASAAVASLFTWYASGF